MPRPVTPLNAYIGKSFTHAFGNAYDLENDGVTVAINLGTASSFATFDIFTNTLMIAEEASSLSDTRFNKIVLTLTDDNEVGALSTTYEFKLVLEEFVVEGQKTSYGVGVIDFYGLFETPDEILANITATEAQFEKRIYDLRETTLDEIYTN